LGVRRVKSWEVFDPGGSKERISRLGMLLLEKRGNPRKKKRKDVNCTATTGSFENTNRKKNEEMAVSKPCHTSILKKIAID